MSWSHFQRWLALPYLLNPSAQAGYDTRSVFKRSLTGLNSEFSFSKTCCLTKAEEPSMSYYLPIAGGRIIGFIPFPRILVLCEMQSVSSRFWTRVAVSISYDDNHYSTGTFKMMISITVSAYLFIYFLKALSFWSTLIPGIKHIDIFFQYAIFLPFRFIIWYNQFSTIFLRLITLEIAKHSVTWPKLRAKSTHSEI